MTDDQYCRDVMAVVKFFAWDQWAAHRAILTHTQTAHGQCAACAWERPVPWPCVVASCAQMAVEVSHP